VKKSYPQSLFLSGFFRIFIGWKGGRRQAREAEHKSLIISALHMGEKYIHNSLIYSEKSFKIIENKW
jgi:hypothetical protein